MNYNHKDHKAQSDRQLAKNKKTAKYSQIYKKIFLTSKSCVKFEGFVNQFLAKLDIIFCKSATDNFSFLPI